MKVKNTIFTILALMVMLVPAGIAANVSNTMTSGKDAIETAVNAAGFASYDDCVAGVPALVPSADSNDIADVCKDVFGDGTDDDNGGAEDNGNNESIDDPGTKPAIDPQDPPSRDEIKNWIKNHIQVRDHLDECIARVQAKYPSVSEEDARSACKEYFDKIKDGDKEKPKPKKDPRYLGPPITDDNSEQHARRLKICVDFIKKNELDQNPVAVCNSLLNGKTDCEEFLNSVNVEDASSKCAKLMQKTPQFVKARRYVKSDVVDKIPEFRLKKIDRLKNKVGNFEEKISGLEKEELKKLSLIPKAAQTKLLAMDKTQIKDKLDKLKLMKVKSKDLGKRRTLVESKIKTANQKFSNAIANYKRNVNAYKEKKQTFIDYKAKLAECEASGEDCTALEAEAVDKAKEFLTNAIDLQLANLDRIKSKIEGSELIGEDEAENILSEISGLVDKLNEIKSEVEAAETKDDIKAVALKLQSLAKQVRLRSAVHAGRIINNQVENIVVKSENLESKLDCALATLEEQGVDTANMDAKVEQFSEKVDSASSSWEEAKTLFQQARDLISDDMSDEDKANVRDLISQGKEKTKLAHDDLKEAYRILKSLVKEIRSYDVDLSSCAEKDEGLINGEVYQIDGLDQI